MQRLSYSKQCGVIFYGIGWMQSGECKSGSLEGGEKEGAGTADLCLELPPPSHAIVAGRFQ